MNKIQRYTPATTAIGAFEDGEFVFYTDHCAALAAVEKERDRFGIEMVSILKRLREAMDGDAIEGCAPSEMVALLISQRDNAKVESDGYKEDAIATGKDRDEALAVLREMTAAMRRYRLLGFGADLAEINKQEIHAEALLARHAPKEARETVADALRESDATWTVTDVPNPELLPLLADCVTFLEQAFAHVANKPACLAPAKAAVEKYSA